MSESTKDTKNTEKIAVKTSPYVEEEKRIMKYWEERKTFEGIQTRNVGKERFTLYDGPPFATGLPHYGHVLVSTIKDIFMRYKSQMGFHVPRGWGWDTHGLPIEFEIEKELGIKTREEVLAFGIDRYNEACRNIVMRYSEEWRKTITRLGRWVDFERSYQTMDRDYMESVWWIFSELHRKGLIYEGVKVMPYSIACATPLANFEAKSNYHPTHDIDLTLKIPLAKKGSEVTKYLLVFTTTPWTLPANLLLCVHPEVTYVEMRVVFQRGSGEKTVEHWIMANNPKVIASNVESVRKIYGFSEEETPVIVSTFKGREMVGWDYIPLFNYYVNEYMGRGGFKIVCDEYVSEEQGTGIVHIAPAFGQDDYHICEENGLIGGAISPPCPLDANGRFTEVVKDFVGLPVKPLSSENIKARNNEWFIGSDKESTDSRIVAYLRERQHVHRVSTILHEYPFCWRSETPLVYRTVPSWFIKVSALRDELVGLNKTVGWNPEHIRDGRFGTWLSDTHDWCVSRNRYWGTPIPIWTNQQTGEIKVISSIRELETLVGLRLDSLSDIHRHNVDDIKIPSEKHPGTYLTRIDEVFDCWFESGSMPYASVHYPFENAELVENEKIFPGDFIVEGLDQTRGWFYTMLVLSTALFGKSAYKHVSVTGLVLAKDKQKMSKSKRNYPDLNEILEKHGSDALRMYLVSAGLTRGESMAFDERGISDITRSVHIYINNALSFLAQSLRTVGELKNMPDGTEIIESLYHLKIHGSSGHNAFDTMMIGYADQFLQRYKTRMETYDLSGYVTDIKFFVARLSKLYINLNKSRVRTEHLERCWYISTIFQCLRLLSIVMAPIAPFLAESMYQKLGEMDQSYGRLYNNLSGQEEHDTWRYSVHEEPIPDNFISEAPIIDMLEPVENVVDLIRQIRQKAKINSVKRSLLEVKVIVRNPLVGYMIKQIIPTLKEECNIINIDVVTGVKVKDFMYLQPQLNGEVVKNKFGKDMQKIVKILNKPDAVSQNLLEHVYLTHSNGNTSYNPILLKEEGHHIMALDCILKELPVKSYMDCLPTNQKFMVCGSIGMWADVSETDYVIELTTLRQMVHFIQDMRKKANLKPHQKIQVFYDTSNVTAPIECPVMGFTTKSIPHGFNLFCGTHLDYIQDKLSSGLEPITPNDKDFVIEDDFPVDEHIIKFYLKLVDN